VDSSLVIPFYVNWKDVMGISMCSLSTFIDSSGLKSIFALFILYLPLIKSLQNQRPFYFLYLGFLATLLVHLGTGPLWQFVHQKSESCRVNFWKHFLYIDNYFDNSNPLAEVSLAFYRLLNNLIMYCVV